MKTLKCNMIKDCQCDVSYIDEKGFIYCSNHGKQRQYSMRARKLTNIEIRILASGKALGRF